MKLAILIPAYNEEKRIGKVLKSIPKHFDKIDKIEIIVVDDGSKDRTGQIARDHGAIVVTHKRNMRLGPTFRDGVEKAMEIKADFLVTIDADGQFSTSEISKLLKPVVDETADFATGCRFIDKDNPPKNMPWIKKFGNKQLAKLISWATGRHFHDITCGFRAYSKEALLRLNLFSKFTYTQETLLDLAYKGLEIKEIPISVEYFPDRKSRIINSLSKYIYNSMNIIFRTIKDYKPLKFFGITGIIIFIIGVAMDIFVLQHFLRTSTFSPYKILGFLGAFLNATGIMIVFIGILADLIDKIRLTQEKILYLKKKQFYYGKDS